MVVRWVVFSRFFLAFRVSEGAKVSVFAGIVEIVLAYLPVFFLFGLHSDYTSIK